MNHTRKADSSALDSYLRDIALVALLTRDDEQRLARAFRDRGDKRAGHRLVEANLRFVVKVAFEYRWYGLPMPDLIQEGNIGLMKGVQKFDPDKQIRLISYAVWWIRAYIQNHVLKSWSLVKIGTTQSQRRLFFSLARTRREIERLSPGAGPDQQDRNVELVAKKLKVRESDVVEMQQRLEGRDFSLDASVGDGTSTHLESLPSAGEMQDEELGRAEDEALLARRIGAAMSRLDARERHIVRARIMDDGAVKLSDLGRHFGVSRERARQLEIRALGKLRRDLVPVADELGWPVAPGADADRSAARPVPVTRQTRPARPADATTTGRRGPGRSPVDRFHPLLALEGDLMGSRPGGQVVHSYDIARRRVLCGWTGQSSSTKHPAGVTCTTCRELLARGLAVDRTVGSAARPGE